MRGIVGSKPPSPPPCNQIIRGDFSVLFEIKNYLNKVENQSSTEQENEI
jgi:hypothetical protein